MEMRVSEQSLPGIGMRYETEVGDGRHVYVIAHRDGRREIGLIGAGDEPEMHVALDQQAAVTIAALLLGARFTVDTSDETWVSSDEVVVDVVELHENSAAVGKSQLELDAEDPDTVILAVMSDTTPELIESELHHRCQAGDRVVMAARGARIEGIKASLRDPKKGA